MSLLKLWNSIRGRSNSDAGQTEPEAGPTPPAASNALPLKSLPAKSQPVKSQSVKSQSVKSQPMAVAGDKAVAPVKPAKPRLNVFGTNNPHASLCKLIRTSTARTVVEIGVQDGSRTIAVTGTLSLNLPPAPAPAPIAVTDSAVDAAADSDAAKPAAPAIRYIAVDQFEMAGGATTLKQFHRTLREADVRATVYPEPMDRALTRVAHTIGAVDLVLIAVPPPQWQTPAIEALVKRICHPSTQVLFLDGTDWRGWQTTSVISAKKVA